MQWQEGIHAICSFCLSILLFPFSPFSGSFPPLRKLLNVSAASDSGGFIKQNTWWKESLWGSRSWLGSQKYWWHNLKEIGQRANIWWNSTVGSGSSFCFPPNLVNTYVFWLCFVRHPHICFPSLCCVPGDCVSCRSSPDSFLLALVG